MERWVQRRGYPRCKTDGQMAREGKEGGSRECPKVNSKAIGNNICTRIPTTQGNATIAQRITNTQFLIPVPLAGVQDPVKYHCALAWHAAIGLPTYPSLHTTSHSPSYLVDRQPEKSQCGTFGV